MAEDIKARLAKIKARIARTTPGPWTTRVPGIDAETGFERGCIVAATAPGKHHRVYADPPGGSSPAADRDFIAGAPEDVTWLIEQLGAALATSEAAMALTKKGRL